MRILVVYDQEASRHGLLSLLMSRPEWSVCGEAENGMEAVEKAKALCPDVVLVDLSMPRMNGIDATRIIRRELPKSKVVIVSQSDASMVRAQALEGDALAYVSKVDISRDLLPTIERVLGALDAAIPHVNRDWNEHGDSNSGDGAFLYNSYNAASLESILCTAELMSRPSRPPDYEKGNWALVTLAQALADSPGTIFQTLTDTILEVFQVGSAGISLLTKEDGGKRFYWPAVAGEWRKHIGENTPRDFSPCGDVLDRNQSLLFQRFERRYIYFQSVTPRMEEALLVPFYAQGKAVGTIWAVAHDDRRKFDAEDERLMKCLGVFASSAYQILITLDALKFSENRLRSLAEGLESQVSVRTRKLEDLNAEIFRQSDQLRELSKRLLCSQDEERRRIARELHDSAGQIIAALGMNLAVITKHALHNPLLDNAVHDSQDLIQRLSKEIRTTSYLLHPPLLDENGLPEAIRWYMQGLKERSGINIELNISENFGRLPREFELAIFRIVQECLTNIHRHSGSKSASILLSRTVDSVSLEVQDEGRGIPAETLARIRSHGSGVGIAGMRERIRNLNGCMDIESKGSGTKISATFPVSSTSSALGHKTIDSQPKANG